MPDSATRRTDHTAARWLCALCAAALGVCGCKSAPPAGVPTAYEHHRGPWSWLKAHKEDHDFLLGQNDARAGSSLDQRVRPGGATPAAPRALNDVMAQLQTIGTTDPGVQAKLMTDLQRTDPSLWPLVMESYRSTVAYRDRAAGASAPGAASTAGPSAGPLPPEVSDGRVTASPRAAAAVSSVAAKSPWNALDVPAVSATDQVVLKGSAAQPAPTVVATAPTSPGTAPVAAAQPAASAPAPTAVAAASPNPSTTPPAAPATPGGATEPPPLNPPAATPLAQATPAAAPSGAVQQAVFTSVAGDANAGPALQSAIAALEAQTQTPGGDAADVSRQAALRMMYLAAGRRDDALKPIPGASASEQEYWNKQLAGLATLLDVQAIPDAGERAAAAHQRLAEAASRLAQLSPLLVHNLAFCSEVASYGVITRFKETEFTPGQQVLLYAEVENFFSEQTPQGYRTALKSGYQIVDHEGKQVATAEPQVMEELCANARRDYFVRYRLTLPKPLADGAYTLQLSIEDTLAKKSGKGSIDFTVKDKK